MNHPFNHDDAFGDQFAFPSGLGAGGGSNINHHKLLVSALIEQIDTWLLTVVLCVVGVLIFLCLVPRRVMWMIASRKVTYAGKTILITGGSSGIGEEMTKQALDLGAKKVIIAARRVSELNRVKEECKGKLGEVEIWEIDLTEPGIAFSEATKYARALDSLDILVNNAGVSMRQKFVDFDFESC